MMVVAFGMIIVFYEHVVQIILPCVVLVSILEATINHITLTCECLIKTSS